MGFSKIVIGNFGECEYKFPKEENASESLPYCDSQGNILKRVNETEQIKTKIVELNTEQIKLEFRKQKGELKPEEEELLKRVQTMSNTFQSVMSMKPFYINEDKPDDIHYKAFKKLGDEVIDKVKKTDIIPEGEYRVCEVSEKEKFRKEERGELFNAKLYEFLKGQKGKAVKFNMNFGYGTNEQRVYVYPSDELDNVLIINRVGRTRIIDTISNDLKDLEEENKMKELLESVNLQVAKLNRNKIAGNLDD